MDKQKMIFSSLVVLFVVIAAYYLGYSHQDKGEIEKITHNYLVSHPEVLIEASQALEKKRQKNQMETALTAITENKEELVDGKSPVIGNPFGDIILIKFLDYQCPHCKKMEKVIGQLIKENPNLKVIIKELPIMGQPSVTASRAALAASQQGKFAEMHQALLQEKEGLNNDKVLALAKQVGLDLTKLETDMETEAVDQEINGVSMLARKMGIHGTPFFIVMNNPKKENVTGMIMSGSTSKEHLQSLIDKVQKE